MMTTAENHTVYDLLIRQYPSRAPEGYKRHFPAKCWHCFMPAAFFEANCLDYHRVLKDLAVERIGDEDEPIAEGITTMHLPGHSPDSLAVMLGHEAVIVGDVVLPDITPWPTRVEQYEETAAILAPCYPQADALFGLSRYLRSLNRLVKVEKRPAGRQPCCAAHGMAMLKGFSSLHGRGSASPEIGSVTPPTGQKICGRRHAA